MRPPIPLSCANRPVIGGLVAPYVNVRLADGGVDYRSTHNTAYQKCWTDQLCQTCGQTLTDPVVFFGGPNQLATLSFDEPPVCLPCAQYVSRACPMVAGRQTAYADRDPITGSRRGHVCPTAGCDCGGWVPTSPDIVETAGEPAHRWFAAFVPLGAWDLTAEQTVVTCSDHGCEHPRTLINGAILRTNPRKVILVSEPGHGRIWQRIEGTTSG